MPRARRPILDELRDMGEIAIAALGTAVKGAAARTVHAAADAALEEVQSGFDEVSHRIGRVRRRARRKIRGED
jgi:hypothetical protein